MGAGVANGAAQDVAKQILSHKAYSYYAAGSDDEMSKHKC